MKRQNVIILGAAGRDFHNFNTLYRDNELYNVVAFTATQIPDIHGRQYPHELSGRLYPDGIPIYPESDLVELIKRFDVHSCIFSYSDVKYQYVMNLSSVVNAAGSNFVLVAARQTMLASSKPVVAVVAARTGCGKSQTSRKVAQLLIAQGLRVVVLRHPMPYGDLAQQKVQRFASLDDLALHNCTIEEMEEYEPHIMRGSVVYAGVDYEQILRAAENDPSGCDVILWDGGNNDFSFVSPDLTITVVDPHRAGHELSYYPGEVNLRLADVVVINKMDSSSDENISIVRSNISSTNPRAVVVDATSPITVDLPELIAGKRVLVIEDGPTLTHGEMKIGAGTIAAQKFGASEIVDPKPFAVGKLVETYHKYPDVGNVLPAMGYGNQQVKDLEKTINNTPCDVVIIGTPIDLTRIITIDKPNTRVFYELDETSKPDLREIIGDFLLRKNIL